MTSLQHHPNSRGSHSLPDGGGDLPGQPLLDLQPPAVHLHYPRQLGEADHLATGQVADTGLANEGNHVMFTQGEELNVFDNNHLVSVLIEDRILQ